MTRTHFPVTEAGNREKIMATAQSSPSGQDEPTPMTNCPMTAALIAIGGKWNLICLFYLDSGTRRFNELRRLIPEVSHKVLTETLRTLEVEGLIKRTVFSVAPSHVEYEISPHGESVLPLMHAVRAWGRGHLDWRKSAALNSRAEAAGALSTEKVDPGSSPG